MDEVDESRARCMGLVGLHERIVRVEHELQARGWRLRTLRDLLTKGLDPSDEWWERPNTTIYREESKIKIVPSLIVSPPGVLMLEVTWDSFSREIRLVETPWWEHEERLALEIERRMQKVIPSDLSHEMNIGWRVKEEVGPYYVNKRALDQFMALIWAK